MAESRAEVLTNSVSLCKSLVNADVIISGYNLLLRMRTFGSKLIAFGTEKYIECQLTLSSCKGEAMPG